MRLGGDVAKRLACALYDAHYSVRAAPETIVVAERDSAGRAEVTLRLPEGKRCIEWRVQGNLFGFLKGNLNADGAIFVLGDGDDAEAHILECKLTVNPDSWSKAKLQMRATLLRLRALAGVLGLRLTRVVCYTAYCDDDVEPDSSPDAAEGKIMSNEDDAAPSEDRFLDLEARQRQFDWRRPSIHLRDFDVPIPHRKLPLEQVHGVGTGTFRL
jgi:hypothetical protein